MRRSVALSVTLSAVAPPTPTPGEAGWGSLGQSV